jgi:multiple sugar transport system permease protein
MVIVPVVGTMMFRLLFVPSGIAAWLYQEILKQPFIFTEVSVKILIILNTIWTTTPFPFIVMYAGLQNLSQEQMEAALMDGANRWQQIRYIIIPHLSSLLVFLGLISIMDAYRVFDSIFVLTQLNPIYKADSVMLYIFRTAMTVHQLGLANAMSILTVIMILIVLIPLLVRTYREQIEER